MATSRYLQRGLARHPSTRPHRVRKPLREWDLEALEGRLMMASGLLGDLDANGRVDGKDVRLARALVRDGPVALDALAAADRNRDGVISREDLAGLPTSPAKALASGLLRDYNGDGRVDLRDLGLLRAVAGLGPVRLSDLANGDLYRDGRITRGDLALIESGLARNVRPLAVRAGLESPSAAGQGVVNRGFAIIAGRTSAGALVHLGEGPGTGFDQARFASADGTFSFVVGLDVGPNRIRVEADRVGSRPATAEVDLTRVAVPPTISVDSPAAGLATDRPPTLSGRVTDSSSAVGPLYARVDSAPAFPVALDGSGRFSVPIDLAVDGSADGIHQVVLEAGAYSGDVSAPAVVPFGLDTRPPVVAIASPTPGQVVVGDVTIAGTAADALTGVAGLEARVDAGTPFPVAVDASGKFSFPASFPVGGPHSVILVAVDGVGNPSAIARSDFSVANAVPPPPPPPPLAAPVDVRLAPGSDSGASGTDGITNVASPTILVDAAPKSTVRLFRDGVAVGRAVAAGGVASIAVGPLADGVHRFHATTVDAAGGSSVASPVLAVTIDTVPPSAPRFGLSAGSRTDPADPLTTSSAIVTLVGQADPGAVVTLGPAGVSTTADDAGAFAFANVSLVVGANPFTAEVVDLAGNVGEGSASIARTASANPDNAVIAWNRTALAAIRLDDTDPVVAARALAMVQSAVYDAVNAVEGVAGHDITVRAAAGSSDVAAVASAADRVLGSLYPGQAAAFDAELATSLGAVPDGPSRAGGVAAGRAVADAIIAERADDGAHLFQDDTPQSSPGGWVPTAPAYAQAADPQYAHVTPFAMAGDSQFRPVGPPALTSARYAAEVAQVEAIGRSNSTTRTADQTQVARFWNDGQGSYTPPGHWNQIAEAVAIARGGSLSADARLFAMLDVAEADAGIVAWDAKYFDRRWRPITAIRQADQVAGTATLQDPTWTPLLVTPAFPGYVSGHSTFSGAADAILTGVFGPNVAFTATAVNLPGVTRTYTSFAQAADEAGISRVYGGIHFLSDDLDGLAAGRALGAYVAGLYAIDGTQAPRVIVTSPLAGSVGNAAVTASGRVVGGSSGIAGLAASLDGGPAFAVAFDPATGGFSAPIPLAIDGSGDGAHHVVLTATDRAGHASIPVDRSFTLDTRAPVVTLDSPTAGGLLSALVTLSGTADPTGSTVVQLRYAFDGGPPTPVAFSTLDGTFNQALDFSKLALGNHTLAVTATDAAGNSSTATVPVTLAAQAPLTIAAVAPADGSVDVGVTYRPRVTFSRPIDASTLNPADFYATSGGRVLPSTIAPSDDGTYAWLFLANPMPGGSIVQLVVDGSKIRAKDGSTLDGGAVSTTRFSTVSVAGLAGTSLSGVIADPGPDLFPGTLDDVGAGPDGVLMTGDDVYKLPVAGATVSILGRPDLTVVTDAQGRFRLDAIPAGDVKLAINGRTATDAPPGIYFPEMVMDLTVEAGRANTVMGSMGTPEQRASQGPIRGVYLPRVRAAILGNLDPSAVTHVTVSAASAPDLTDGQRSAITADVPAGAAIGFDGRKLAGAQLGISVVPPSLVDEMLPPGLLQHAFDLTMQAPDVAAFSTPVPVTLPNIFNLAPGEKMDLLSFDHTTGRLVIEGTLTVSADGKSAATDPGIGIIHPGWYGAVPGTQTELCKKGSSSPGGPDPTVAKSDVDALKSQFFKDDKGTFTLHFQNTQLDPSGKKLEVELMIDGPSADFLDGLEQYKNKPFLLCPGEPMNIPVKLKPKLKPDEIKKVEDDLLYGVQIHVLAAPEGNLGHRLIDKNIYVYRYVDASDDKHDDGVVAMIKATPGVERDRTIVPHMNPAFAPVIISDSADFHVDSSAKGPSDFAFTPSSVKKGIEGKLAIFEPGKGGKAIGSLEIKGDGVIQKVYINKTALADALRAVYTDPSPDITPTERSLVAPSVSVMSTIIQPAIARAMTLLKSFKSAVMIVNAPGPDTVDFNDFSTPFFTLVPGQLGKSSAIDDGTNIFGFGGTGALIKDQHNYNPSEFTYRLASLLNNSLHEEISVFIDKYFRLSQDNFASAPQVADTFAKTFAHELGHAVGLFHTSNNETHVAVGSLGADADIMAQGQDLSGSLSFTRLTRGAFAIAVGAEWSKKDAQDAKNYYSAYYAAGGNFDSEIGAPPDANVPPPPGYGGSVLTVRLASTGDVIQGSLDLGTTRVGTSGGVDLDLDNSGDRPLVIDQATLTGASGSLTSTAIAPGTTIAPGSSLHFRVALDPATPGAAGGHLIVTSNALSGDYNLELTGYGQAAGGTIRASVPDDNLGGQAVGNGSVVATGLLTLQNPGAGPLTITAVAVVEGVGEFSVGGLPSGFGPGHPLVIPAGGSYSLDVSFLPSTAGLRPGRIDITSDDPLNPAFHQAVVGTGLAASGSVPVLANDYVAIQETDIPDAPIFRQRTDDAGDWSFVLTPNTPYRFTVFDPITGLVATGGGLSGDFGQVTMIASPVFQASTANDADGDGLPDDVEFATGTSPAKVDTAGFGLGDFATVEQGLDALGEQASTTGVIAGLPLLGQARRVVVEGSAADPTGQTAYVATGAYGLAVVDASKYGRPIAIGQVQLPGSSVDVAVDPTLRIAAVASGPGGLNLVDVSDPTTPRLAQAVPIADAASVVIADGVAYVASGASVVAVDVASGGILQTLGLGGGTLVDLALDGSTLVATDATSGLLVADIGGPSMLARGSLKLPARGTRLSVGGGVAYVATNGYGVGVEAVGVSDPARPRLLTSAGATFGVAASAVGPNGSGLALAAGNTLINGVDTPTVGLLKVSDPASPAFLFGFNLPATPSDVAVAEGVGIVADGTAGLEFVNFRAFDTKGQPPTASISSPAADADPSTPGVQVVEGRPIPIRVAAGDDVQVRNVELLVDGVVVANAVTFPFGLSATAPLLASGRSSIAVQVRATDTGGNATLSNALTFGIVADRSSPRAASMSPAPGSSTRDAVRGVSLSFDKPLDPASVAASAFTLVGAGPDGSFGTADDVPEVIRSAVLSTGGDRVSLILAGTLPPGAYRLTASSAALRDLEGHALDGEFAGAFPSGDGAAGGDFVAGFRVLVNVTLPSDAFPARRFANDPAIAGLGQGPNFDSPIIAVDLTGSGRKDIIRTLDDTLIDPRTNVRAPFNAVSVTPALPEGGYGTPVAFQVGDRPVRVVAGDLNGDRQPDLVVLDDPGQNNSNAAKNFELSVLIARDGTFRAEARINTNLLMETPGDMVLGDFLGRGRLDLAVLIPGFRDGINPAVDARLALFPGNGDGTFGAPIVTDLGASGSSGGEHNLASAVLTRNGRLDLVTSQHILLNVGDGTFAAAPLPGVDPSAGDAFLAVADFAGTGVPEIVLGSDSGNGDIAATILRGSGDGTYRVASTFVIPVPPGQTGAFGGDDPVVADLNGDGKPDLVVTGQGLGSAGDVAVLLNRGDGTFAPAQVLPVFDTGVPPSIAVADAYGAGREDLLIGQGNFATGGTATVVLTGHGDGTFDAPLFNPTSPNLANRGNSRELGRAVGDINGDGIPDVVRLENLDITAPTPVAVLQVALGLGDGTFGAFVAANGVPFDPDNQEILAIGDLDGRGRKGLIVVAPGTDGLVEALVGKPDGTLGNPIPIANTHSTSGVVLIDANHDGKLDLFAETNDGLVVRLGRGDGTFGPGVVSDIFQTGVIYDPIAFGDFNGDGFPDLFSKADGGQAILGRGDGSFYLPRSSGYEGGGGTMAVGDFNGDGKLDAIGYGGAGNLFLYPGRGDGSFALPVNIPSSIADLLQLQGVDVNGDGLADLVVANRNEVDILLNNGDGTFQPPIALDAPGLSGKAPLLLDLNHDGLIDILAADTILLRKKKA